MAGFPRSKNRLRMKFLRRTKARPRSRAIPAAEGQCFHTRSLRKRAALSCDTLTTCAA